MDGDGSILGWVNFLVSCLVYEGPGDVEWGKSMAGEIGTHRRDGERDC